MIKNCLSLAHPVYLKKSKSELYRPSDRRLTVKLVPTFAVGDCVASTTDPYGGILGFLD
jgi:hypothetical protein